MYLSIGESLNHGAYVYILVCEVMWLHYDEGNLAFCHPGPASAEGRLRCETLEPAFIRSGFSNREDARDFL